MIFASLVDNPDDLDAPLEFVYEPTNNLDTPSAGVLEDALSEFQGVRAGYLGGYSDYWAGQDRGTLGSSMICPISLKQFGL